MSRRRRALVMLALVFLMINLPLLTSLATERRVRTDGIDVSADVVRSWVVGSGEDRALWLSFTLPAEVDRSGTEYASEMASEPWAVAKAQGTVLVRVLEDRPSAHLVDGGVVRRTGVWITLVADALLALLVVALWRSGRYADRAEPVRLEAVTDLAAVAAAAGLVELGDGTWEARGTVVTSSADEVELDLADRRAVVILDGHKNPVAEGRPAVARGRLLDG